jgi:DNA replication licensing factor MCM2
MSSPAVPSSPASSPDPVTPSSPPIRDIDDEDELPRDSDEEEDGEDLGDTMLEDYKAIPELDRYEDEDLDNEEYDAIDYAERQAAERLMRKRDIEDARRSGRTPALLADGPDDDDADIGRARRRRRIGEDGTEIAVGAEGEVGEYYDDEEGKLEDITGGPIK